MKNERVQGSLLLILLLLSLCSYIFFHRHFFEECMAGSYSACIDCSGDEKACVDKAAELRRQGRISR